MVGRAEEEGEGRLITTVRLGAGGPSVAIALGLFVFVFPCKLAVGPEVTAGDVGAATIRVR